MEVEGRSVSDKLEGAMYPTMQPVACGRCFENWVLPEPGYRFFYTWRISTIPLVRAGVINEVLTVVGMTDTLLDA